MNNKTPFSRFTWFVIGLASGLVAMFYYQLGIRAGFANEDANATLDYYLWSKAESATVRESDPVIIYAWTEYLDNVERLRGRKFSHWVLRSSPSVMLDAHGCLAKLYAESGETNLSQEHLDLALRFAQATGLKQTVTNQATLLNFIDSKYGWTEKRP